MRYRDEDDLINPSREFFRLFKDYREGSLTRTGLRLYRARVDAFDPRGGALEQNPPNPPNSCRARIFTAGMDASLPQNALTVFYPMLPPHMSTPLASGEHIYVTFEDEQMSQGLWISSIPNINGNINFANPDTGTTTNSDSSTTFEGDSQTTSNDPGEGEYASLVSRVGGRPEMADDFENADNENVWRGQRILHIGDSMVVPNISPLAIQLGNVLRTEFGASSYQAGGRQGWGVIHWLNNRFRGSSSDPSLEDLAASADILLLTLGGNDALNGQFRETSPARYIRQVEQLWNRIQSYNFNFVIWCGPPSIIGRRENGVRTSEIRTGSGLISVDEFTRKRDGVNQVIREVVGDSNFLDCRELTAQPNLQSGRGSDGIHFARNAAIGEPWARLFVNKAARR